VLLTRQSAKDEIKRAADILEVIGQYVQLRKAGRNYVGLCPFHAEKDPSFTVSPERQTFHCFGCKKGGDIFTFWMEYHSETFPEAVRDLAEKYNVTIQEGFSTPVEQKEAKKRSALVNLNETAALYFQNCLFHPDVGKRARKYIKNRGLSDKTISEFRIGYSPDRWDGLINYLRSKNSGMGIAFEAGLVVEKKSGGYYDRFRGRIIFPIFNVKGQVVGFGGRVLDDSLPKYLNTPETPLFAKGRLLYGLHASAGSIREKKRAVIVEGYMDCLALINNGLSEVVATLGTALTADHLRRLKGYCREAVLLFDSDEAGKKAAVNSLSHFSNEGLSAKAVLLPDGYDPDGYVNAKGLEKLEEHLVSAPTLFDFYLEQKISGSGSGFEGKVDLLKEVFPPLFELRSEAQRALYIKRLADTIGIREEIIWSEFKKSLKKRSVKDVRGGIEEKVSTSKTQGSFGRDHHLLNLIIYYPEKAADLIDTNWRGYFSDPLVTEITDAFFSRYNRQGAFPPERLLEDLGSEAASILYREAISGKSFFDDQAADQAIAEIKIEIERSGLEISFRKARARGDIKGMNEILKMKRSMLSKGPAQ